MPRPSKQALNLKVSGRQPAGDASAEPEHDRIALRAYELWLRRGCPLGSPEEDWNMARTELRNAAGK